MSDPDVVVHDHPDLRDHGHGFVSGRTRRGPHRHTGPWDGRTSSGIHWAADAPAELETPLTHNAALAVLRALARFPYLQEVRIVTSSEPTVQQVVDELERVGQILRNEAVRDRDQLEELDALKADVAAMRRVFGIDRLHDERMR
jgi:hypothetical protein